jgi:membrane-associated protein
VEAQELMPEMKIKMAKIAKTIVPTLWAFIKRKYEFQINIRPLHFYKINMTFLSILDLASEWLFHLDEKLQYLVQEYRSLTYFILFAIVFTETGLVVMPLLPGDSLLFAAGSIAALDNTLNIFLLIPILILAALLGDNTNYFIGSKIGVRIFDLKWKLLKREYLTQTEAFYEKHGGYTLIMARFVPIVRTFAPFAAGMGTMPYKRFITFCILGAVLWVCSITSLGYALGQNAWVKSHFETVVFAIIGISILPMIYQFIKHKWLSKKS